MALALRTSWRNLRNVLNHSTPRPSLPRPTPNRFHQTFRPSNPLPSNAPAFACTTCLAIPSLSALFFPQQTPSSEETDPAEIAPAPEVAPRTLSHTHEPVSRSLGLAVISLLISWLFRSLIAPNGYPDYSSTQAHAFVTLLVIAFATTPNERSFREWFKTEGYHYLPDGGAPGSGGFGRTIHALYKRARPLVMDAEEWYFTNWGVWSTVTWHETDGSSSLFVGVLGHWFYVYSYGASQSE
mmetsp:Transcript_3928/g.9757  ORF Transcript_3928/g.9757 Transcript_3928/m.9757 type:complete len:240 (+) Transcript_3928:125-844(+)